MSRFSYVTCAWILSAITGCASNPKEAGISNVMGTGTTGVQQGGDPGGASTAGTGDENTGATGDDDDGGAPNGDANVEPNDPPTPAEACGKDLDAHNGTVLPNFQTPTNGSAFSADPIENGALKVVLEDKTLKNPDASRDDFKVTAYAPSTDGRAPDAGPFPLIVVLPGFSGSHTGYRSFTDHFVSHGFAVLGVTCANVGFLDAANNPANVAEIGVGIKWALEESQLKGKVDLNRMAIAGHSQGGKLAFFTAATDTRFKLVLGWDPQNGGGAPCFVAGAACDKWPVAPVCDPRRKVEDAGMMANIRAETLVFAARDATVTPDEHLRAEHFYRGAPSPASMLLFPAAGHGDWGGDNETSNITKRVQMALLLTKLMGKTGLDKYLPDGDYAAGQSSVMVYTK